MELFADLSDGFTLAELVKISHLELSENYARNHTLVRKIWPTLPQATREQFMREEAPWGFVLEHFNDNSLPAEDFLVPEWNVRDITAPDSMRFLDLLDHCVQKSLAQQYVSGGRYRPGDREMVTKMIKSKRLQDVGDSNGYYMCFMDGRYGEVIRIAQKKKLKASGIAEPIRAKLLVPLKVGELVLKRQWNKLEILSQMMDAVIWGDMCARFHLAEAQAWAAPYDAFDVEELTEKTVYPKKPPEMTIPELVDFAQDRKAAVEEYLHLIRTEPLILHHATSITFSSRPELFPDDRGRSLPPQEGKYVGQAVLDAVCGAAIDSAIWTYISHLVTLLPSYTNNADKEIILRELCSVCQLEYSRRQAVFKKQLACTAGPKWFKRVSNASFRGPATLVLKGDPEAVFEQDPLFSYLLYLCKKQTNAHEAVHWLNSLDNLITTDPHQREKLAERNVKALSDLEFIVAFTEYLNQSFPLRPLSRKKRQGFVTKIGDLEAELNEIKPQLDLSHLAPPIDDLLEASMAKKTLEVVNGFLADKGVGNIASRGLDIVERSSQDVKDRLRPKNTAEGATKDDKTAATNRKKKKKAKRAKKPNSAKRKKKKRSKKSHGNPPPREQQTAAQNKPDQQGNQTQDVQPRTYKVKASTYQTFSTLFDRTRQRGGLSWTDFESAMVDLGFSVYPKFGSVINFRPADDSEDRRSVTVHRPHGPQFEGKELMILILRLGNKFHWNMDTVYV